MKGKVGLGIGRDPGALRPLRVAADHCEKRFFWVHCLGALFGCPLQGWWRRRRLSCRPLRLELLITTINTWIHGAAF